MCAEGRGIHIHALICEVILYKVVRCVCIVYILKDLLHILRVQTTFPPALQKLTKDKLKID